MTIPPPLRPLDIRPLPDDPERMLVVDPLGIQPDPVGVPLICLLVAQEFDGSRDLDQIAATLSLEGLTLKPEEIQGIARQLADFHLLADDSVKDRIGDLERQALTHPRQAHLAGKSYPADPGRAAAWIDGLLARTGPAPEPTGAIGGIVLPHIDPRLGGSTYALGYRSLLAAPASDVYVVIGIGHAGLRHGLSLAPVDFSTPLGAVQADRDICQELVDRVGDWILADQLVQQREHSVEFQAVFLKHLVRRPFTMVPLLAGFGPADLGRMRPILSTLRQILAESGKRVTVVASVDFSHVGPMYGDPGPAGPMMGRVEDRDRQAIACLERADDAGFWRTLFQDGNATRVCGYSSMGAMLALTEPRSGQLLDYGQGVMDGADSRVTFAAMRFPA